MRFPPVFVAGILLLVGCSYDSATVGKANMKDCSSPVPRFLRSASVGETQQGADGSLAVGLRDSSVTVVGVCSAQPDMQDPPALKVGRRMLEPVGGLSKTTSNSWVNYFLYPATQSRLISVIHHGDSLGTIRFQPAGEEECPLGASGHFRVVSCDSLVVLNWDSSLPYRPGQMELLDVTVRRESDEQTEQGQLGFYLHRFSTGPQGLVIRFSFLMNNRPGSFVLEVHEAYVRSGGRIKEISFDPSVATRFRLTPN